MVHDIYMIVFFNQKNQTLFYAPKVLGFATNLPGFFPYDFPMNLLLPTPRLKPNKKTRNMARPRTAHGGVVLWRGFFLGGFSNGKVIFFPCNNQGGNSNYVFIFSPKIGEICLTTIFQIG